MPEKAGRVLYRFREDTENRSPSSCRASRCSDLRARPRPTSEGIETQRLGGVLNGTEDVVLEPDPAPPPRGLKRNRAMDLGVINGRDMKSPTPPHLRGD